MADERTRIPYLDNARLAMMFLVVFGHVLETSLTGAQGHLHLTLYLLLYLFHVPVWVFLAGITSKAETAVASACRLLSVLVVFQILYAALAPAFRRETHLWYVTPYWILWFLLSLIFWKLLLPVANRIRGAIPISVAIALAAGCFGFIGRPLSFSRTVVWFPMFLAGHFYGRAVMAKIARAGVWMRVVALTCFVVAGVVLWFHPFNEQLLYEAESYSATGLHSLWVEIACRAEHMAAACVLGLCVLALIPSAANRLSYYGSRTLAILTLHPLLIRPYGRAVAHWSVLAQLPMMIIVAAAITWLTGAKPLYQLVDLIYRVPQRLSEKGYTAPAVDQA